MVAADTEVFAYAAAVGSDGLVVRDAVEQEQFLQASELSVGQTDGLFIGQPFGHVLLVCVAALISALPSNEDKLHIVALGYLGSPPKRSKKRAKEPCSCHLRPPK